MTSYLIALAGVLQSQDIDVDQLIKTLKAAVPANQQFTADGQKKLQTTAEEAIKDKSFEKVDLGGISKLAESGYLDMLNPLRKAVSPRLQELSSGDKPENARASVFCATYYPDADSGKPEVITGWIHCIKHALSQPALPGLLKDDSTGAAQIFSIVQGMDPKDIGKANLIPAFFPLLKAKMTESAAVSAVGLVDAALEPSSQTSAKDTEETRELVKKAFDTYALPGATGPTGPRKLKYYKSIDAYLDGAAATGKLMNQTAPDLRFTWSNTSSIDHLSQLKGKVVVLDFWATWCGPCVRSFPNVRKIQEHYKDSQVVILGVTSLQGYHMDRVAKKRIDTKDNPLLEYSLMPGFMKDQNMTWNVAFSTDGCFDPNFGVRGIPHMAIIDANGKVRYNYLRPYEDPSEEAAKIDGLLKEAGLPVPAQPIEKGNWAH